MELQAMFQKMVDLQRSYFDTLFDMIARLQDQSLSTVKELLEKTPNVPENGIQAHSTWVEVCQQGRQTLKTAMNESFDIWSSYFEKSA
jgi:hypothetical protein